PHAQSTYYLSGGSFSALINTTMRRYYRLTAVCLGLLCVILLAAITVLWIKFNNLTIDRDQLQTNNDNMKNQKQRCFRDSFYYISTEKKSWSESRKDCKERGADLVIINKQVRERERERERERYTWIGLRDVDTEGVWKWLSSAHDADCAVTGYKYTGSERVSTWADYSCDRPAVGICEKRF
uniref:C-type lectin domain-containing protein n=1 Tax=Pygocentrus nattereri TaxID=42514 RepID=A0A3B4E3Q8_PYGNA